MESELLTVDQVAKILQASRSTVYRLLSQGLPSLTLGDLRRVRRSDLMAYLDTRVGATA